VSRHSRPPAWSQYRISRRTGDVQPFGNPNGMKLIEKISKCDVDETAEKAIAQLAAFIA
jgi:hypothetical protein